MGVNAFVVKKFFPEDDDVDPISALLLLPIIMIQELMKIVFIFGSWVTWIVVVVILFEEWVKSSIKKRKT